MPPKKKSAQPPAANSAPVAAPTQVDSASSLPLWLVEGATQRDKNILCENIFIYTPDGRTELIKNSKVQFVAGRRYGLIGPNGSGNSLKLLLFNR